MAADIENRDAELARLADTHGVDADRLLNVVVLTAVSEAAAAAARVGDHHMVDCEMAPLSAAMDHERGNDWLKHLTAAPPTLKWDVVAACRQFTAVIWRVSQLDGAAPAPLEQPSPSDDSPLATAIVWPPETARALSGGDSCVHCRKPLEGGRRQRRFCTGRCRAAASRERKAKALLKRLIEVAGARR